MVDIYPYESDEPFSWFAEWIAAQPRLFFRALKEDDQKGIEVSLFYFRGFLVKMLTRHLRQDPRWNLREWWLDMLGEAMPEVNHFKWLRLRDEIVWATRDQKNWYRDPFEFELRLDPQTGAFLKYTFRFGDFRPLGEKEEARISAGRELNNLGEKDWVFFFAHEKGSKGT